MVRVLQLVGSLGYAGLEAVVMNYYRNIDREKIQFDFIVSSTQRQRYDDEIESMGGTIYRLPSRNKSTLKYVKLLKKLINENKYDVIHLHTNSASIVIDSLVAKSIGVRKIIAHSHNTSCIFKLQHYLLKPFLNNLITTKIACSIDAGEWLYSNVKDVIVYNNAIQCDMYKFEENKKNLLKRKIGFLENDIIIGHIGRFEYQKNHEYLINIFSELCKKRANYKLILIGDGHLLPKIKQMVSEYRLVDKVVFLGNRDDVADLLKIMDVFLLPSFFEGLPVVLVEAQASGLKCVVSTGVPNESDLTGLLQFVSLDDDPSIWAELIDKLELAYDRDLYFEIVKDKGYDICSISRNLAELYLD